MPLGGHEVCGSLWQEAQSGGRGHWKVARLWRPHCWAKVMCLLVPKGVVRDNAILKYFILFCYNICLMWHVVVSCMVIWALYIFHKCILWSLCPHKHDWVCLLCIGMSEVNIVEKTLRLWATIVGQAQKRTCAAMRYLKAFVTTSIDGVDIDGGFWWIWGGLWGSLHH